MKKTIAFFAGLLLLFASCAAKAPPADISDPSALYEAIAGAAGISDMLALSEEELLYMIGVEPDQYTAYAAYTASSGTSPEEILIFRASDEASKEQILETLQNRLRYKQDSAAQYLTENQGILRDGVVRADGLTVSLIVTENIAAALSVYP